MRCLLCIAVVSLAVVPVQAGIDLNPNTLNSREIAEGWLLLFDGDTTFGWKIDGEAKVADGVLTLGGEKVTNAFFGMPFDQFDLRVQFRAEGAADAKSPQFVLQQANGTETFGLPRVAPSDLGWQSLTLMTERGTVGSGFRLSSAFRKSLKYTNRQHGRTAIGFTVPAGNKLMLRNVKLKPAGLRSIFNGKDLAGWKIFPGRKSKFTVTPEGWLNIKNGNGDLQTEGQWGDFVLQLECISNGKHLNSGVFFRCRPNEYQNGYEAQIQNDFTMDPPREYLIDVYDSASGKVANKVKFLSQARDFGTGAIYRRVPARRAVAKDHEWFTMTVVAQGRHLATWVNGIQVTDWTDNRPFNDNARNGCRLEKGPISLQGHDPTTDLSFRNLRVAELVPAAK